MNRKPRNRMVVQALESRDVPSGAPLLDSWLRGSLGEYAKIINGSNVAAGPVSTWPGNSSPVLGDVQKISSSTSYVYVQAPALASYVMGPWFLENGSVFPNYPTNQNRIVRINKNPAPATTHTSTPLGSMGMWVNGVNMFNMLDAFSWNNTSKADLPTGMGGDGYWERDADAIEGPTFDHAHAHQPPSGEYHYHSNPSALRAQLGDNIAYEGTSVTFPNDPNLVYGAPTGGEHPYHEMTNNLQHSPILGWTFDGYPVYGPYGYSDPNDASSAIARMTTGYRLRNITTRTTLPGWAAKAKFGEGVTLNANGEYALATNQYGPAVSATYGLGRYVQDYEYVTGLGTLDVYNGRFTKTPEFPNGTYAYFVTIDAAGEEVFPYFVGRQYYGQVTSGKVTSITETVTSNFDINAAPNGGTIHGVAYVDANGDGMRSFSELGLSDVTVYVDANGNNAFDAGESNAKTGVDGSFDLSVATNGNYVVRAVCPANKSQTTLNPGAVSVKGGNAANGLAFGFHANPPTVTSFQVNDGAIQRSQVTSLLVTFSDSVTFPNGANAAFTLERTGGGGSGTLVVNATPMGNSIKLSFAAGSLGLDAGGSLLDGLYRLTITAAEVVGTGGAMSTNSIQSFHRLYGDADGNRSVDAGDFAAFRSAYGTASSIFDAEGDGQVDSGDFARFRMRFGLVI